MDLLKHLFSSRMARLAFSLVFVVGFVSCEKKNSTDKPNVIVILADDLGYGDIARNQSAPKISTPSIDQLMASGMHFDNAHTASSVCTPSRYALLTGEYSWRSKLKSGVLFGYDQPLIQPEKYTIGKLFQSAGYTTSAIGKWHLGLPWELAPESNYKWRTKDSIYHQLLAKESDVAYDQPFSDTNWHKKIGFDHFYGISASLDIPPYVMIENGSLLAPLDARMGDSEQEPDLYDRDYWREGVASAGFDHNEVLPSITHKTVEFIEKNADHPFFIYFALTAPHSPWLPREEFRGKSQAGKYGDFLAMVDWSVGEVLKSLEEQGIADNTIVIFTSDNGAPLKSIEAFGGNGHAPNGIFRGQKGDLYEGGHHVPLIISWPKKIQPNTRSSQLVVLTDLVRTLSDLVGIAMPERASVDSKSFSPALLGEDGVAMRTSAVYHSQIGTFAVQNENWKLIDHLGSGGFSQPRLVSSEDSAVVNQLYNLQTDATEKINASAQNPEIVSQLRQILQEERLK